MKLSEEIRTNLIRLWESKDSKNRALAFQLMGGYPMDDEDGTWLYRFYQSLGNEEKAYSTLKHHHFLSDLEILKGRILEILLDSGNDVVDLILQEHRNNGCLRLPYTTHQEIPSCIIERGTELRQLIWQDGELEHLGREILALEHLEMLDLRRQPITYIHPEISDLQTLKEIFLVSASFIPPELSERGDVEFFIDAPY